MTARAWGLLALFVVALCVAPFVHAGTLAARSLTGMAPQASLGGRYVRVVSAWSDPVSARVWSAAGATSPGIVATDAIQLTARAGGMAISTAARVTLSDGALAVARCIMGGGVVCGVVSVAAGAYWAYRTYHDEGGAESNLMHDPGIPTTLQNIFHCSFNNFYGDGISRATACEPVRGHLCDGTMPYGGTCTATVACNTTSCTFTIKTVACYPSPTPCDAQVTYVSQPQIVNSTSMQACPVVNDSNPRFQHPAGLAPGPDGKCWNVKASHVAITAEAARAGVDAFPPPWGSGEGGEFDGGGASATWRDAVKTAIDDGMQTAPATITTTGPAQQLGPASTITTTTGDPPVTTTDTTQQQYDYTYPPPDGAVEVTESTKHTAGNGTVTTTTGGGGAGTGGDPTPDPCIANPDRAGCHNLGTPPTDGPTWTDHPVSYAPEDVGPSGACPAPLVIPIHGGQSVTFSWVPVCDVAPLIRAVVLMLTALSCAFFVVSQTTKV